MHICIAQPCRIPYIQITFGTRSTLLMRPVGQWSVQILNSMTYDFHHLKQNLLRLLITLLRLNLTTYLDTSSSGYTSIERHYIMSQHLTRTSRDNRSCLHTPSIHRQCTTLTSWEQIIDMWTHFAIILVPLRQLQVENSRQFKGSGREGGHPVCIIYIIQRGEKNVHK